MNVFMHQLSMCIAGGMYLIETSACLVCLQSIISCRHVVSHASQASHSASAQCTNGFFKTQKITHHLERQFLPHLDAGCLLVSWILCRNHWRINERGVPTKATIESVYSSYLQPQREDRIECNAYYFLLSEWIARHLECPVDWKSRALAVISISWIIILFHSLPALNIYITSSSLWLLPWSFFARLVHIFGITQV